MHEHPATDASDPSDPPDPTASIERAARFLDKVRLFASGLDPDERELLATLLGPGVALAHRPAPFDQTGLDDLAADDGTTTWRPSTLPSYLADTLRSRGADVTGPATSWPTHREPD